LPLCACITSCSTAASSASTRRFGCTSRPSTRLLSN
jgi:hypothetical protein